MRERIHCWEIGEEGGRAMEQQWKMEGGGSLSLAGLGYGRAGLGGVPFVLLRA